jgi:hypothetical protein
MGMVEEQGIPGADPEESRNQQEYKKRLHGLPHDAAAADAYQQTLSKNLQDQGQVGPVKDPEKYKTMLNLVKMPSPQDSGQEPAAPQEEEESLEDQLRKGQKRKPVRSSAMGVRG